jgi:hypothetical protein
MTFPKSFYYFKLGILFFILCKINNIKSRNKRLILFNKIKEFNKNEDIFEKIYKHIFKRKNCLIFSYYMQLPNIFLPIPNELIYYKPYITFYNNNIDPKGNINNINNISFEDSLDFSINVSMKHFYTNRIKIQEHKRNKWLDKYIQDQHIFPDIQTIFIPINNNNNIITLLNQFTKKEKDVLYLMFYDNNIYVGKRKEDKFNLIYMKTKSKYFKIDKEIILDIKKLTYIVAMLPITKIELIKTFDIDIIKENSLLYHNRSDDLTENVIRRFYGLYPNINLINPYGLFNDADYHCFIYKLKKDLKVINLNKDIFYHDLFDTKDNSSEFIYKDTSNNNKLIQSKLFHCVGDNIINRKQCNLNIIKDYNNINTWRKNKGKRMLCLIIAKTSLYWLDDGFYYVDFLSHYNIEAFIYHYGIYKNKLLDVELGFTTSGKDYVEYISMHKGECK